MKKTVITLSALVICLACLLFLLKGSEYELVLINIGSLESRLTPFKAVADSGEEKSYGGVAYLYTALAEVRREHPGAIVVQPGDLVMGRCWNYFHGEPEFKVASALKVDVGMLGNQEFNLGTGVLKDLFKKINPDYPILLSNVSFKDEHLSASIKKQTIIKTKNNIQVGFFSLMTPWLTEISRCDPKEVHVEGNILKVATENVSSLKKQGADVVVLISHNSLPVDLEIASKVKGINVVISSGIHKSGLPKLQWVAGPDGWMTAVYSANTGGKNLSTLKLYLKNDKNLSLRSSLEIMDIDDALTADKEISSLVATYENQMETHLEKPIGIFLQSVDARKNFIRSHEAPLGRFVADAIRNGAKSEIAVINSGGIRGDRIYPAGAINGKTVGEILPFSNTIWIKQMRGSDIEKMLAMSVSSLVGPGDVYKPENRMRRAGFLQVSGIYFTVSLDRINSPAFFDSQGRLKSIGNRVKGILVQNDDGSLSPLNATEIYTVAMPDFLADGGDGYTFIKDLHGWDTRLVDADLLSNYIESHHGLIEMKSEERMKIIFHGRAKVE